MGATFTGDWMFLLVTNFFEIHGALYIYIIYTSAVLILMWKNLKKQVFLFLLCFIEVFFLYKIRIWCFLYKCMCALIFSQTSSFRLTRRRHDMGNLLGNETSCESSTPLSYSTLNVLAPKGQWFLRKTPLKFYAHIIYY